MPINGQVTESRGATGGSGATTFIRRLGSPETAWDNRADESEAQEEQAPEREADENE